MKKVLLILLISVLFTITGCTSKLPDLDKNYTVIEPKTKITTKDEETFIFFDYNGRSYIPYGTTNNYFNYNKVKKCIGYILQTDIVTSNHDINDNTVRVYTLKGDKNNDYLMVYYIGTTLMNQPDFYRAIDTKNIDIKTPKYIESLNYDYWK